MIEEKEFVDILVDLLEENNGKFHRDQAIERLTEETELDLDQSRALIRQSIGADADIENKFDDRGFATLSRKDVLDLDVSPSEEDVSGITMTPGPPTDDTYYGLTVLKEPREGHPLVPSEDDYFERDLPHAPHADTTDVEALCTAMSDPDFSPLLIGDAGTGKDTLIRHVCSRTNRPVVRVNFGSDIRYEDLVGMYTLNKDKEMVWRDGYLTSAVKYGWVFIADELNAAPPESTMPLHQVTEERGKASLVLRTKSEVVEPHHQFRFVGTMNPEYHGTNQLNDAFKSRFYPIEIDYLDETREAKLLKSKINDGETLVEPSKIETLCGLAKDLRQRHEWSDIMTPITTRELIKICKMAQIMTVEEATRTVLIGHVGAGDEDIVQDLIESTFA
jgi:MoxR-like ATPase